MIVPDMSVMYTLCGNDMYVNENDLVYFRLNYVAGRGFCIACNTLRMLVFFPFFDNFNIDKEFLDQKWGKY